jgi:shikimate kinase
LAAEETLVEHVALIGLPGAGKSAVGALLARSLGRVSADLDRAVERAAGRPVPAIFAAEGEGRFRDLESLALAELLHGTAPLVLACGGGVLGRAANRELLKEQARVVWLTVQPEEAAARLGPEGWKERPLLRGVPGAEQLRALLDRRAAAYAAAADLRVTTDGLTAAEVAARVRAGLEGAAA